MTSSWGDRMEHSIRPAPSFRRGIVFAIQLLGVVVLAAAFAAGTLYVVWAATSHAQAGEVIAPVGR